MGLWTFLTVFVVCGCAVEAYRAFVKSRAARNTDTAKFEARMAAVESLEERVQTLEAIVTDPKAKLDREIGKLAS